MHTGRSIAPLNPETPVGPLIIGSCDGTFRPRSHAGGRFGCGWQLALPDQLCWGRRTRPLTRGDSSHSAELEALLALLDAYLTSRGPGASQLVICSDSRTLVGQVTGTLHCRNGWCAYLLQQIQQRLAQIEGAGWPVLIVWTPREYNQAAHALAQRQPTRSRPATRIVRNSR